MMRPMFDESFGIIQKLFGVQDSGLVEWYWKRMKAKYDCVEFAKMCNWLADNYEKRGFPKPKDFEAAHYALSAKHSVRKQITCDIPEPERITPQEVKLLMACGAMIADMHKRGVVWAGKKLEYREVSCPPMSFDEWAKQGQPPTYSPVYDWLAEGALQNLPNSQQFPGIIEDYFSECLRVLGEVMAKGSSDAICQKPKEKFGDW